MFSVISYLSAFVSVIMTVVFKVGASARWWWWCSLYYAPEIGDQGEDAQRTRITEAPRRKYRVPIGYCVFSSMNFSVKRGRFVWAFITRVHFYCVNSCIVVLERPFMCKFGTLLWLSTTSRWKLSCTRKGVAGVPRRHQSLFKQI